jgi:hypothetical protein
LIPCGSKEVWSLYNGSIFISDHTQMARDQQKHHRISMKMNEMDKQRMRKYKYFKCDVTRHSRKKC